MTDYSYSVGRKDFTAACENTREISAQAARDWKDAASEHGHASYWGAAHIRQMRAYWLGVLRLQREHGVGFWTFHPARCIACDLDLANLDRPVSADLDDVRLCDACLASHDGPGKFEGLGSDLALAIALYYVSLNGGQDEDGAHMDEDGFYSCRIGRYILSEDDRGFVAVDSFETEAEAEEEISRQTSILPAEEDGFVHFASRGISGSWNVSLSGSLIAHDVEDEDAAVRALWQACQASCYWPNLWTVNERGNTTRLEITNEETGEYRYTEDAYV